MSKDILELNKIKENKQKELDKLLESNLALSIEVDGLKKKLAKLKKRAPNAKIH